MNENQVKHKKTKIALIVVALVLAGMAVDFYPIIAAYFRASPERRSTTAPSTRPADWAQPIHAAGLNNAYRVSGGLIRGAQPTAQGMASLEAMGVKTVVNLEVYHGDAAAAGLDLVGIKFDTRQPRREQVVEFLRVVNDPARRPVYVHCFHGSDRTGTMVAMYRIAVEGWTKQQAIDEMIGGGYGFHPMWQNLLEFIDQIDVDAVRRDAGI